MYICRPKAPNLPALKKEFIIHVFLERVTSLNFLWDTIIMSRVIGRILVGLYFILQFVWLLLNLDAEKERMKSAAFYLPIKLALAVLYSVIGLFFVIDFHAQYAAAFVIGLILFEALMLDSQGPPLTRYPKSYRFHALLSKIVLIAACLMIIAR